MARRHPHGKFDRRAPAEQEDESDDVSDVVTDEEEDGGFGGGGSPVGSDEEDVRDEQDDDDDGDDGSDSGDDDDDGGRGNNNKRKQQPDRLLTLGAKKQRQQQRAPIYDAEAMHDRLEDIAWAETEGATFAETLVVAPLLSADGTPAKPSCPDDLDIDDDLARELCFYNQALGAAKEAVARFEAAGVQWHRPADYYAEMVKSDEHMAKVKDRLMYEQQTIEQAEERRKAREHKAFAKQTAAAKQRERAAEKKRAIEAVSALRKQRARTGFAGELDDEAAVEGASAFKAPPQDRRPSGPGGRQQALGFKPGERIRRGDGPQKGKKRLARDAKYGFGGRKRLAKQNDARSAADMDGYRPGKFKDQYASRMKGKGGVRKGGGGGGGGGARPGKARRQQQRSGGGGRR